MKCHSKLSSFLMIKTKVLERFHAVKAVNSATRFQKHIMDSVEANRSWWDPLGLVCQTASYI